MAFKQFALDEHTFVTIYKRKTNRSLRLSVAANGEIRVTIPVWAPYSSGLDFARSRYAWIQAQRRPVRVLTDGQSIGKAHHLTFAASITARKPFGRIRGSEVFVTYPTTMNAASSGVQAAAETAAIKALRLEAEELLPKRLQDLAERHGYTYRSVTIKRLKSRWGSCDQDRHIVLNLFLMQLPWNCIDYVLLHELAHTEVMRHGPDFWQVLEDSLPGAKQLRKTMRQYQPILHGELSPSMA